MSCQVTPVLMSNKMYDEITRLVRASYRNACVLFIDEINNPELKDLYEEQKASIVAKRGIVDEKLVFHGTHAKLINVISREGFDPEKNVTSAYGKGSYFATTAQYSQSYMKSSDKNEISYMFLAQLAVGKCVLSNHADDDFDNYVNSLDNPSIFVTPYRYGAYPKYVIAFHKNAI